MGGKTTRRESNTGSLTRTANGRWKAVLDTDPDPRTGMRHRVSVTRDTRSDALRDVRRKAMERVGVDVRDDTLTVGMWLDEWLDTIVRPRKAPNTTKTYERQIRVNIKPSIGNIRLGLLAPRHLRVLEQYATRPTDGKRRGGVATAKLAFTVLHVACVAAVNEGLLDRDPTAAWQPVRPVEREEMILSPDQIRRMIGLEPDRMWRLIWMLLFMTGLRKGEVLGLTPGELVERDGVPCIMVEWQLQRYAGLSEDDMPLGLECKHLAGSAWLVRPKTRNGRRLVPLPRRLADELSEYVRTVDTGDLWWPVFRSSRGLPLGPEPAYRAWVAALDRAGLPRVRLHAARHAMITMMTGLGASDGVRELLVGHADVSVTNRVYTHAEPRMLAPVVEGVYRLISEDGVSR